MGGYCSAAPALECKHGVNAKLQTPFGKTKQIESFRALGGSNSLERPSNTDNSTDVMFGNPVICEMAFTNPIFLV